MSGFVTEEEAKTKWCPMARSTMYESGYVVGVSNTRDTKGNMPTCIGSECMMWRSAGEDTYAVPSGERIYAHSGYCGLAGRPGA